MNKKMPKSLFKKRLPLLAILVAMIFSILLVSMLIAGVVLFLLVNLNVIPAFTEHRFIPFVVFLLLVSLLTGTILAMVCGKRFLRNIYELVEATKEVAAGNFNVRMKTGNAKELFVIADSFNEMVKELSSIETLRSDFVSNISHEFKTPISSIRGFARRLKKENLTAQQRNEYVDIIIAESERLSRLSGNVLLLSRLDSAEKISDEAEYSLDEQIRRTVLLFEPQFQKKQLEVDVALESVRLLADEEILSHIWINLLVNAIKFSPDGGTIKITLGTNDNSAVATISDMGIGMDDEVKKRIFDKFYQGDKSRVTEGNGLGLALVKRILELVNGKIEVDSELGKGTVFTVSLPLK